MPKFFVKKEQINNNLINIIGKDVNHISKVLRAKVDDEIYVGNQDDANTYLCKIKEFKVDSIKCEIIEMINETVESNVDIHILQGLPKADKMELIIQKATEIGVKQITPVEMERCIVKLDEKDKVKKLIRWQTISEVAAKQSGRDLIPKINEITKLKNLKLDEYDLVIVAYENEKENKLKEELIKIKNIENPKIAVIIGPEGGIDIKEVEKLKESGAKVITLGNRILRTETVALVISSMIMYELEK